MRETSILVSTKAASPVEVVLYENVAKTLACLTAKGITDVHPVRPFYIIIASLGKGDVHFPKHQKVGEVRNTQVKKVPINDKRVLHTSGTVRITVVTQ